MARSRRRWIWWTAGTLAFVACVIVAFAAAFRGPYAFLERFHPKRYEVARQRPPGAPPIASTSVQLETQTILEFPAEQADEVLQAMRRELTPARGYDARERTPATFAAAGSPYGRSRLWVFMAGDPGPRGAQKPIEYAAFWSGAAAVSVKRVHLAEPGRPFTPIRKEDDGCIVVLYRRESWIEMKLRLVRQFLHL